MKINLKDFIAKHSDAEGNINFEEAQTTLTEQVNGFVAKNKPDMDALKIEAKDLATKDFIGSLGIENVTDVDSFKAHTKRLGASATDVTEANSRLTKELEELKVAHDTTSKQNAELTANVNSYQQNELISKEGFNPKFMNSIKAEANSLVTEELDFASALGKVKETFPDFLTVRNAGTKTPPGTPPLKDDEEMDAWRKQANL